MDALGSGGNWNRGLDPPSLARSVGIEPLLCGKLDDLVAVLLRPRRLNVERYQRAVVIRYDPDLSSLASARVVQALEDRAGHGIARIGREQHYKEIVESFQQLLLDADIGFSQQSRDRSTRTAHFEQTGEGRSWPRPITRWTRQPS